MGTLPGPATSPGALLEAGGGQSIFSSLPAASRLLLSLPAAGCEAAPAGKGSRARGVVQRVHTAASCRTKAQGRVLQTTGVADVRVLPRDPHWGCCHGAPHPTPRALSQVSGTFLLPSSPHHPSCHPPSLLLGMGAPALCASTLGVLSGMVCGDISIHGCWKCSVK